MSQEFLTVSLEIANKASPRLSLVATFAKIAVDHPIDTQTSSHPCLHWFIDRYILHFY